MYTSGWNGQEGMAGRIGREGKMAWDRIGSKHIHVKAVVMVWHGTFLWAWDASFIGWRFGYSYYSLGDGS